MSANGSALEFNEMISSGLRGDVRKIGVNQPNDRYHDFKSSSKLEISDFGPSVLKPLCWKTQNAVPLMEFSVVQTGNDMLVLDRRKMVATEATEK